MGWLEQSDDPGDCDDKRLRTKRNGSIVGLFIMPTMHFRWLTTTIEMCDGPGNDIKKRRLQQCYMSDTGDQVWQDVPEHEVSNEEFNV